MPIYSKRPEVCEYSAREYALDNLRRAKAKVYRLCSREVIDQLIIIIRADRIAIAVLRLPPLAHSQEGEASNPCTARIST